MSRELLKSGKETISEHRKPSKYEEELVEYFCRFPIDKVHRLIDLKSLLNDTKTDIRPTLRQLGLISKRWYDGPTRLRGWRIVPELIDTEQTAWYEYLGPELGDDIKYKGEVPGFGGKTVH